MTKIKIDDLVQCNETGRNGIVSWLSPCYANGRTGKGALSLVHVEFEGDRTFSYVYEPDKHLRVIGHHPRIREPQLSQNLLKKITETCTLADFELQLLQRKFK